LDAAQPSAGEGEGEDEVSSILDAIQARLNAAQAAAAAAGEDLSVERGIRAEGDAALGTRLTSAETTIGDLVTEYQALAARVTSAEARIGALVGQLVALGVEPNV
jgi:uncharacterized protein involved in exopolysaccharide biosynthesis